MKWIINKKLYMPFTTILSVVVYTVNVLILNIVIQIINKVIRVKNSSWYKEKILIDREFDVFYKDRTDFIIIALIIAMIVLVALTMTVLSLFRKIHLNNYKLQIGHYKALGYTNNKIRGILKYDYIIDLFISIPISYACTLYVYNKVYRLDFFKEIVVLKEDNSIEYSILVLVIALVFIILYFIDFMWLRKIKSKNIIKTINNRK